MFFGLANFSISYASFPIKNQIINSLDISKFENIDEYHSNLIKMGFDISSCKCKECREKPKNFVLKKKFKKLFYNFSYFIRYNFNYFCDLAT